MIEEIKRIKVSELEGTRELLESQYNNQPAVLRVREIEAKIKELKRYTDDIFLNNNALVESKKFNFIQRFFTKRSEYKDYKKRLKIPQKISSLQVKLAEREAELAQDSEAISLYKRLDDIRRQITAIGNATVLRELDMTLQDAIQFLEQHEVTPVLTEADQVVTENPRDYSSKSGLIAVHKTRFQPFGDRVRSDKEAYAMHHKVVTINQQISGEYEYLYERDTVHMALNDEVSSHSMGSWDDCKYAVLVPFDDIPNSKIKAANPVDTYTKGGLELTGNSWILCPESEVEQIRKNNPRVNVIGYKGDAVLGYPQPFLSSLGYRAEDVGPLYWKGKDGREDNDSMQQFHELCLKEGLEHNQHFYSAVAERESVLTGINEIISICKLLKSKGIVKSKEARENFTITASRYVPELGGYDFPDPFISAVKLALSTSSEQTEFGTPDDITTDNKHIDLLFEQMAKNGFEIDPIFRSVVKSSLHSTMSLEHLKYYSASLQDDEYTQLLTKLREDSIAFMDPEKAMASFFKSVILRTVERETLRQDELHLDSDLTH